MANDNSRKFKQNQIIFCIQPWFVEYSRPIVIGEDRLRERGSLPATVFFLSREIFFLANDNSRKFKQNQIMFRIQPWIVEFSRPIVFGEDQLRAVSYTHLDVYKRQSVHLPYRSRLLLKLIGSGKQTFWRRKVWENRTCLCGVWN